MAQDFNDQVFSGSMKVRGRKLGILKPRWLVLRRASSTGPDRLEICKSGDDFRQSKIIPLTSILSIHSNLPRENMINVETNAETFQFCFDSVECYKWLDVLSKYNVEVTNLSGTLFATGTTMAGYHPRKGRKDNDCQNSLAEFNVFLLPSYNLSVTGECLLIISTNTLAVTDIDDRSKVLVSWDLNTLRKYGRNADSFYIESGSRSKTGEGLFMFNTVQAESIYEKIHQATLALASAMRIYKSH